MWYQAEEGRQIHGTRRAVWPNALNDSAKKLSARVAVSSDGGGGTTSFLYIKNQKRRGALPSLLSPAGGENGAVPKRRPKELMFGKQCGGGKAERGRGRKGVLLHGSAKKNFSFFLPSRSAAFFFFPVPKSFSLHECTYRGGL